MKSFTTLISRIYLSLLSALGCFDRVVTNPFLVKQFHAYAVGMLFIVMLHMAGMKAPQQHSPFMEAAHAQPVKHKLGMCAFWRRNSCQCCSLGVTA